MADFITEYNSHLTERFGRGKASREPSDLPQQGSRPIPSLNLSIRKYVTAADTHRNSLHWTDLPEFPLPSEIFNEEREDHHEPVELDTNLIVGPYPSKEDYLERHYRLLREDALAPLRDVVSEIQVHPHIREKDSENDAFIYERAYITGYTFANSGLAARLTFSLNRVGKQINWEQSKRLRTGTILALSPMRDGFRSVCRIAVVAARPLNGLRENPPSIDIFFVDQIEIDPQVEWILLESRQGFFEGHRHVLRGLQAMARES